VLFDREAGDLDPQQQPPPGASDAPSPDAVQGQLEKTLRSKAFINSPQLCRFLRFVVEQVIAGRGDELKEYVLAIEVFHKDESFDARLDTMVRTEARRLRQKLAEYYQTEGRHDPIEIVLPKGSYRPAFQSRRQFSAPPQSVTPSKPSRISRRQMAAGAFLLIAASASYWAWTRVQASNRIHVPSIAVLPFENLSRDPEQEYFSDGMTDALFTDLAKIHGLSVISRTSVMQYKRSRKDIPEIARALNVDYVVEGTVTRAGDRVRITAQLIAASTDRHVWAESYERAANDILSLQSELARAIAKQVDIRLTTQEQARLVERPVSLEARDLYLRGRFNWQTRDTSRLEKSVEYFKQAVARQPDYALAYAGLADSYGALAARTDRKELWAASCDASANAIRLDDNLGEAHAARANCLDDWAWSEREREFRRAIELSPGYATAHSWYGGLLINTGRFQEGLSEMRRGTDLDPLSPTGRVGLGWALYITGQYDQAIAQHRQTLEVFPDFILAYMHLGIAYTAKGAHSEAIATLDKAMALTNGAPPVAALLAHARARAGDAKPARLLLEDFKKRDAITPILFGLLYIDTDDKDRAFEWLAKAIEQRSQFSDDLKVDPMYQPLHSDPRWLLLLRKMKLSN
jgi:TolB-like protein/Tfp pilus assembly protein PilF